VKKNKTRQPIRLSNKNSGRQKFKKTDKLHCPICNADCLTLLVRRSEYTLYKCNNCGLTFKHIVNLSQDIVQGLQDSVYTESYLNNRLQQRKWIKKMNADRLAILRKWIKNVRILEVGCGSG